MQLTTTETQQRETVNPKRAPKNGSGYASTIAASRRIRWDIDKDVIRGRSFDIEHKFLPDSLSGVETLEFLTGAEKRFLSQIQGRSYANIFGLVERFINAKILELSQDHWLGDQTALEALVRFSDEELKHQELFRRIEKLAGEQMPDGYVFVPRPDDVASAVLSKSTWSVLLLTLHIELFTQLHYRESIEPDDSLSELFRDVFLYHWKEESQHARIDELELRRWDRQLDERQRDRGVDDFIDLVAAVDGILQLQADADSAFFAANCGRALSDSEAEEVGAAVLAAYRWQYILSGAQHPRFLSVLMDLTSPEQVQRIVAALAPLRSE